MKYDFETLVDRRPLASAKWNAMDRLDGTLEKDVIPFSTADMEYKNPPEILASLRQFLQDDSIILGYSDLTPAYEEALRSWMHRRHGWDIEPEWNVVSPGVVPALYHAVQAFTKPDDGVLMLTPVYYPFLRAASLHGRTPLCCPLKEEEGRYTVDWDAFEAMASRLECSLFLLCSPHNPVGRVWTPEELRRMGDICNANHVLVVADEIHNDLILPGHSHTVYATLGEEYAQNCIVCTAPSKTFNLAGLQVSNILIPNEKIRASLRDDMAKSALNRLNILGIHACETAYNACEGWLEEALHQIDSNRQLCEDFFAEHLPQLRATPLEGTYLQWWDCRALGLDDAALERFMQREAKLFLDEGAMFGPGGSGFERINLACPAWVLQKALTRLEQAVKRNF